MKMTNWMESVISMKILTFSFRSCRTKETHRDDWIWRRNAKWQCGKMTTIQCVIVDDTFETISRDARRRQLQNDCDTFVDRFTITFVVYRMFVSTHTKQSFTSLKQNIKKKINQNGIERLSRKTKQHFGDAFLLNRCDAIQLTYLTIVANGRWSSICLFILFLQQRIERKRESEKC